MPVRLFREPPLIFILFVIIELFDVPEYFIPPGLKPLRVDTLRFSLPSNKSDKLRNELVDKNLDPILEFVL